MGVLVAGYGVSHTGMIIRRFDASDPVQDRLHQAFSRVRDEIDRYEPDVIVIVGSEHLNTFSYASFPQICIGMGKACTGWGDAGVASAVVPLATDFADQLLTDGVEQGFDLAFAADPRLDHGFMTPLTMLRPEMDIPIVPVFQNASTPPLPPLWRSAQLGTLLCRVIEQRPPGERALLLATGGLSHWVGTPQMGEINREFDDLFLDHVRRGDLDGLLSLTMTDIVNEAGNGAAEIRNWVTVMAAHPQPGEVIAAEPVPDWATGIAVARLFLQESP